MKIRTVPCFLLYCVLLLMQMTCVSSLLWRIPQSSNPLMGLTHSLQRMGAMMANMVRGSFPFSPSYPPRRPPPYYYQAPPPYPHVQTQYLGHSNEVFTNNIEDQYVQEVPSDHNIYQGESFYEELQTPSYSSETYPNALHVINVSDVGDSSSEVSYTSDTSSIDNYGTPQASVIVSNDLEGDMEDFLISDVLQQASAAVPDQANPGQYYNDDQQSVSIVLNNPPFRSEAVNKFLGVQQPFNQVFFFR